MLFSNSEEEHGDTSGRSESHKSDSEEIDAVEIEDEEHGHIVIDNNGPPPCKLARKQVMDRVVHCDVPNNSSTDTEIDGIPIKASPVQEKVKWPTSVKTKHDRKAHVRKKILSNLNVLTESVEGLGSSSSQEDGDTEDSPVKMRKRRKFLRKARVKRQKGNTKRGIGRLADVHSEIEVDSDHEIRNLKTHSAQEGLMLPAEISSLVHQTDSLKPNVYLEESSSCSDLGKEEHHHVVQSSKCGNYITVHSNASHILEMLSGEEAEVEGKMSIIISQLNAFIREIIKKNL